MNTIPDYYRLYSKVLRATLEELRTRGWTRGVLEDRDGHVCAVGAMQRALGCTSPWLVTCEDMEHYLTPLIKELFPERLFLLSCHPLITFNDYKDTSQEDVEALLEKGAIRAEELA